MTSVKSHTGRRGSLVGRKGSPFHRIWTVISFICVPSQDTKQRRPFGLSVLRRRGRRGMRALNQGGTWEAHPYCEDEG